MRSSTASTPLGQPRHTRARLSGGLLLALTLVLGAIVIALAYVGFVLLWPRWPAATATADAPALPITVSGVVFNLPPAAIRVPQQRRAGPQERVDLAFMWPTLAPPDPTVRPVPVDAAPAIDRIFVTISGASSALAPAERMKAIYPRYFAEGQFVGPDGLVGSGFRDGTPYHGEDLFYDAAAADRFMARCSRAGAGATPGTCLLERRIGACDVTVRFPRDWLSDWRGLAAGVDRLIASLRPSNG